MATTSATATIRLGVDLASLQSGLRQAATIAEQNGQSIKAALIRSTDEASTRISSSLKNAFTIDGAIGKVGLAIAGLGAGVGIGALIMQFNKAVDSVAALKDMSEQTGASVKSLSAISAVAKISGMNMESLGGALGKLAVNLEATGGPSEKVRDALSRIGLSAKELANMDTGEKFIKIAEAMNRYEDSGVKAAVATEIFGKQGRTLLPLFNDMAEAGTLAAKTTAEQAELADAFDKNLKRLQITQNSLYKSISMEVLPSVNAFVEALTAASASSDGLRGSVDSLASDGSIQDWSDKAVMGLALVIDTLDVLQRGFQVTGKFIGAQAAQIALLFQGEFAAAGRAMSEFYADYDKIASRSYLSGRLQDKLGAGAAAGALAGAVSKPLLDSNGGAIANKAGDGFLQGLQARIEKADQGEYAMLRLQAAEKGVLEAAAPLIDQLKRLDEARAVESYRDALADQNLELEYQASLIGKTATEVALLNVQHKAELELKKQIDQIERSKGAVSADALAQMQAAMEASIAIQQASVTSRIALENRWETGAAKAFRTYQENAGNAAKGVENLFNNAFRSMEDALVQFAMTGKLNFTNLANGIIADIIRMQAQAAVAGFSKFLGQAIGSVFSAGLPNAGGQHSVQGNSDYVYDLHTGGIAGQGGSSRNLRDMSMFADAPRYHNGGVVGLKPNEVPAVLLKGERVLPPGASAGIAPTVNLMVYNQTGEQTETSQNVRQNDSGGYDIELFIRKVMMNDLGKNGPFTQGLASNFGLRRSA
ncbi:MAG: phage tail tape measure C-terminal domain-containing protein [Fluviibacter sp.]